MTIKSTFTETGFSEPVGVGPMFFRLHCSTWSSGPIEYFFGYANLGPARRIALVLSGTWSGQVQIQYSINKLDWTAIPNESYTVNTSRFFNG
jgi:hypothetical protein